MSVKVNYNARCTVVETFETNVSGLNPGNKSVTHDAFNFQKSMDANSTPAATKVCSWLQTLGAGLTDVDFNSLTGPLGTVVGTDLKVEAIKIKNPVGNEALTVAPKASTDNYDLLGDSFKIILLAGQEIVFYGNDAAPVIATGDCITLDGGEAEEVELIVVMG